MSNAVSEIPFRVAVLDDMLPTRRLTTMLLRERLGCAVESFDKAERVLRIPHDHLPDLYLLDIYMEGLNGLDLCKKLKADEATKQIPIILFSAHTTPQTRVEALSSGAVDYLDKPFFPEELIARVRMHIIAYQQNLKIETQMEEQRALLRVLCHDLQNPLAAIHSLLELQRLGIEDDITETNEIMSTATSSALDLLAHIREYRQLVDGQNEFSLSKIDVAEATEEALKIMRPIANDKNIELSLVHEGSVFILANRVVLIHNVLNNLVSNAIKFSPEGSLVTVVIREEMREGFQIGLIEVIDKGTGISEHAIKNLFDPVRNLSRVGTNAERGSGFGMPLVKRYMKLMQGDIMIKPKATADNDDPGTKVSLSFRLAE